jgi:retinoid hydroxylase
MNQFISDVMVLEDGQALPPDITLPPRTPKWQDTFAYIANPDQFCRVNREQYGPIFQTGIFGGTTVLVGSSRVIQMVFNGDSKYTEIGLPPTTMEMFGEYSLFQKPDLHRQRKSALIPAFTGQMLGSYLPHIHSVLEQHLQVWNTAAPMQLVPSVERVCFDILVPLLLGKQLDHESAFVGLPISSKPELKSLYKTFFDGFYGLLKWNSPLTTFGRGQRARFRLIEFMRAQVQRRRANQAAIDPTADFLSMMLANQQSDPESVFSDALIENQCLLQLWASHYELMGLVSSWIYQLGHYPEMVHRLRSEQVMILGKGRDLKTVSLEQLKQMVFLEATIKETLRTLPPSSTATRRLTKSVVLDGVLYKKGWGLVAEPRIAHEIADYFTQPNRFDPDRFLPERSEGRMYEFIPFGGGVHACLGAQLAMLVVKVFAVNMLYQFDWRLLGEATFVQFPLKRIQDNYQIQLMRHVPDD